MSGFQDNNETLVLGETLSKARKSKGWSIEYVARETCAPQSVILAIEGGESSGYPRLHWQAFLRRYASLLEVPLSSVDSQGPMQPPMPPLWGSGSLAGPKRRYKQKSTWRKRAVILTLSASLTSVAVMSMVPWPKNVADGHTTVGSLGAFQPLKVTSSQALDQGRSTEESIQLTPFGNRSAGQDDSPIALSSVDSNPESAGGEESARVELRLTKDSWVELTDAMGQRLTDDLLRAPSTYSFEGRPPFQLFVGVGSAVEIEVNGQLVNHLPTHEGVGARLESLDSMRKSQNLEHLPASVGLLRVSLLADGTVEWEQ
jgi:cytoskeletal protein RodZ